LAYVQNDPSDAPTPFPSSWRSILIFSGALLIIALLAIRTTGSSGPPNRLLIYVSVMAFQWGAVFYIRHVVHGRGRTLGELIGGRWQSARAVLLDLLIAALFWISLRAIMYALAYALRGSMRPNVQKLLPETLAESVLWVLMSMTAGFCEELMFRGFVQRQLHVLTSSAAIAVVGQAVLFGVTHGYQGWRSTVTITLYGLLIGALAQWRRSLRPGMIAHAWQDIVAGLIKWRWL
jgi:membrane protease YdiL (CAAX protease family)